MYLLIVRSKLCAVGHILKCSWTSQRFLFKSALRAHLYMTFGRACFCSSC